MKHILSMLMLSIPLSALSADLKIEDFKGQFARLTDNKKCMSKIVVDVYKNRLRIYDLTRGAQELAREVHNEKVRIADILIEGSIDDKILIEKRYKLKRAVGIVLDKTLISEVKVIRTQDSLQIEDGEVTCHFGVDLPEIVPPVVIKEDAKPELPTVEAGGITDPAVTDYLSIKRYFKTSDELLDVAHSEDVLKRINNIKSATREYHADLIEMIAKKEILTAGELALALQLPYFTAKDAREIAAKIKEVSEADPIDKKLLTILTQNANIAETFGAQLQYELADLINKKIESITVDELKLVLKVAYSEGSEQLVGQLLTKIKELSLEDKRGLIPDLEKVEAIDTASRFAIEILRNDQPVFSTDELLSNPLELKNSTLVKVLGVLGKEVSDPSLDNFDKLADKLKGSAAEIAGIARVFLVKIPVTAPQEILRMVGKLSNGYYDHEAYKDDFIIAASAQVTPLTVSDADQLLKKMGYEVKRSQLFDKLIGRLTEELTVASFESLVKNVKNGYYDHEAYRDQALLKHYTKIQQNESQDFLKLLDLLSSHASRKNLALGIYGRDKTKTLADVVALALKVNNGYYDHEDWRDQVLAEGVKALTSLTVAEMKLLEDTLSANNKRLAQLKANVNKLPTLSVEDNKLLISKIANGYYDHENYKDQALLTLLPKTIVASQADITSLMSVATSEATKKAILAVGYKLTLNMTDLALLVSKESNSILKVQIIKAMAPKIVPLAAKDVVTLTSTVANGYYDYENHKVQALNFLLDLVKISEISELKLLIEQRLDAVSRVAIYKKLKAQIGAVTAANLMIVADLIANGYYDHEQYKDDLILSESKLIASLTRDELVKLTDKVNSSAKDRVLITQMAPKLSELSDVDLSVLLAKIANGYYDHEQYRDDTAVALAPIVKAVSTDGINTVIKTIGGHAKRKKVALILLAKKGSVAKADIESIALNINNGYYDHENYKTQFLAEAVALIKQ